MQADRAAAKGKAVDLQATEGTPVPKQSFPASPAKSKHGRQNDKPAASVVLGVGTSKGAITTAGLDALPISATPTQHVEQAAMEAEILAGVPAAGASKPGQLFTSRFLTAA